MASKPKAHTQLHKDGSVWARGQTLDGQTHGYWEWFRKDGTIMRSGTFDRGEQVGEWITYSAAGKPHKVTQFKTASGKATVKAPAKKLVANGVAKAARAAPKTRKPDVLADDFLALLDHPLKPEIEATRRAILSVDKAISDGVKWNSLSFRTTDWFATVNLRSRDAVQLVLHLGAKPGKAADADEITDPKGLLAWRDKDRAVATLGAGNALKRNLPALKTIIKKWLCCV